MKKLFTVFLLLPYFLFTAQTSGIDNYMGEGCFRFEGKVLNCPEDGFAMEMVIQDYISQHYETIYVKNGVFKAEIPITDVQDIFLAYCDEGTLTFFSFPEDIIVMEYDYENPSGSVKLYGKSEARNRELELCVLLSGFAAENPISDIRRITTNPMAGKAMKIEAANKYYDARIQVITDYEKDNGSFPLIDKFKADAYFETCQAVLAGGSYLLPEVHCADFRYDYYGIDYSTFRISSIYRHYLEYLFFDRFVSPFAYSVSDSKEESDISTIESEYFFALSQIRNVPIRDWYITIRCLADFPGSDAEAMKSVYEHFKSICGNSKYIAALTSLYDDIQKFNKASEAPDFRLLNEKGEYVSLSDFKGQIVYLDFWGTYCGACINQFKNFDSKFHQKYRMQNIVHIYICFEKDEKKWKKAIEEYGLQGVNLIVTERARESSVYNNYTITSFPHYTLIGKNGKVYKNGCESPAEMLNSTGNSLDRLLKVDF